MKTKEFKNYAKKQGLIISHKEASKLEKQMNQDRFLNDLFRKKGLLWKKNNEIKILKEESLTCQICGKYFKNRTSLWNHLRVHRNEIGRFTILAKTNELQNETGDKK